VTACPSIIGFMTETIPETITKTITETVTVTAVINTETYPRHLRWNSQQRTLRLTKSFATQAQTL